MSILFGINRIDDAIKEAYKKKGPVVLHTSSLSISVFDSNLHVTPIDEDRLLTSASDKHNNIEEYKTEIIRDLIYTIGGYRMGIDNRIYQDNSDIDLFNLIGNIGLEVGYNVKYFKAWVVQSYINKEDYVHYIQLFTDDNDLYISIYYETGMLFSLIDVPYYELYDNNDVFRFTAKRDEAELLNIIDHMLNYNVG